MVDVSKIKEGDLYKVTKEGRIWNVGGIVKVVKLSKEPRWIQLQAISIDQMDSRCRERWKEQHHAHTMSPERICNECKSWNCPTIVPHFLCKE